MLKMFRQPSNCGSFFLGTFPEPHMCLVFSKYLLNKWIYDLIKSSEQSRRDRYYCPHFYCCSVAKCPTLWDPMDCGTPSFPVLQSLLKLMSIELVMPSNHLILCSPFSSCPQSFSSSGSFPMSWLFGSDGQSIGASVSVSVLPVNIQGWFPLGLTGLVWSP